MEEEVQDNVQEEVVPHEQDSHVEQETESSHSEPESTPEEDAQERNWREVRRKMREQDEQLRMQRELIQELKSLKESQSQIPDELDSLPDDEYIPVGKVRKLVSKEAKTIAQQEMEAFYRKQEQAQFMDKLKRQYSDFQEVVTPETLALLEEKEPELAQAIADAKDPYKIGVQSYKYIKALGLVEETPKRRRTREVEKKLEKNEKHVQSPQAFEKRPMAQAFRMTQEEKTKLYEEMMNYAQQSGFSY